MCPDNPLLFLDLQFTCTVDLLRRIRKEDAYGRILAGRLSSQERSELLNKLIRRANAPRPSSIPRGKSRYAQDFMESANGNHGSKR